MYFTKFKLYLIKTLEKQQFLSQIFGLNQNFCVGFCMGCPFELPKKGCPVETRIKLM